MKRLAFASILALALAPLSLAFATGAESRGLTISQGSYPIELHPYKSVYAHEMQLFTAIYEGLFSYDPESLDPVRAQAASFEKSKDGKTWTFAIRDDAKWADGSPVTASDFVESWLYLLSPELKAEYAVFFDVVKGAKEFRTGKGRDPRSVGLRAPDAKTLVVELETPASYFTRLLCHSSFVPIHPSLRGVRTWKPEAVIGNGPYAISSFDDGAVVLERSKTYWDEGGVAIASVRIERLADQAEATRRYNDGAIDWMTDMVDLDSLVGTDDIRSAPMFATGYYFWNASRRPWSDARVRRALALLVPWDRIRTEDSYYAPTSVLVLPFAGYKSPKGIDRADEEEAGKLLAAAGFPGGKGLPPVKFVVHKSETQDANVAVIAEAWAKVGVSIERVDIPDGSSARELRQKGYTLSFTSWIGDFADPVAFLFMWTSDSGLNEGGYRSKDFDRLVMRSMGEEGQARYATLAEAEAKLLADAPLLPLYHSVSFNVIDAEAVLGWYDNPLDIHPFKAMSFGGPKARPNVALADAPEGGTR